MQVLTIDVVVELTWGWMATCDASRVLATKAYYRGIPVASPGADAAFRVLKAVLRGQLPNQKAWSNIRKFTRDQPRLFREVLDGPRLKKSWWKKKLFAMLCEKSNLRGSSCLHALCYPEAESMRNYGLKTPIAVIPNGSATIRSFSFSSSAAPRQKLSQQPRKAGGSPTLY